MNIVASTQVGDPATLATLAGIAPLDQLAWWRFLFRVDDRTFLLPFVDAAANPTTFANDPRGTGRDADARFVVRDGAVRVAATRALRPGARVLVGYGDAYWAVWKSKCSGMRSTWSIWDGCGGRDHPDLEISSRDDHRSKNEPKRPHLERGRRVSRLLGPTRTSGCFPHRYWAFAPAVDALRDRLLDVVAVLAHAARWPDAARAALAAAAPGPLLPADVERALDREFGDPNTRRVTRAAAPPGANAEGL